MAGGECRGEEPPEPGVVGRRFARSYPEQTERDCQALLAAVARGVVNAENGQ
jgi:hypothetical protein